MGSSLTLLLLHLLMSCSLYWLALNFVGKVDASSAAFSECSNTPRFPAMFGFGTSLTDAGNGILSSRIFFPAKSLPYGSTFFGRPNGRFCDGRIMIDFVADAIGLPYLNPYLNKTAKGTDFSNGVNYAVAGANVQKTGALLLQGAIPFLTNDNFNVQVQWHLSLKQAAEQNMPFAPDVVLPDAKSFSEALYFIEFGGNDYGNNILNRQVLIPFQRKKPINTTYIVEQVVPVVIDKMVEAIEVLYANDARNFLVLNLTPEGCAPLYLKYLMGSKDSLGCLAAFNDVDLTHNRLLLSALQRLSLKYSDIHLMYADVAKAYTDVLTDPFKYGFKESILTCCGAGPQTPFQFSALKLCSPRSYKCEEPSTYVVWDGVHTTEAMNNYLISTIASGENLICVGSN